ncbi:MAG: hypothetical protein K9J16_04250 [Melioribacteraceae bacterium]|nr:hypothetical protein [Melioribacteraceae bacterium]MCF8353670.1 hypothetical protein [Melioribacteraceae bacterium]MCF8394452.1 hypothetical protein [Melioribacteraceae bacterium]MCF8418586.1 hypothetical protein [Melioribacteraceae bacterium]
MSKRKEYIVYYSGESYTEQNLEYLLSIADSAVQRVKDVLNIDDYSKGFYLIMLDSRDEMEQAIGERYKGLASGNNNLGIFVFNQEIRPYFKHELFHLFAFNVWGEPASRLLDEGGAMYSDNECLYYKDPISTINKYLYAQGKWFDLDILINNFNSAASENDLIAYLESAFIFRFLFEKFGMEKIKKLWVGGFQQFEEIYGFSIPQLNSYISKEMKNIENQEVNWEELMNKGCG